MLNPRKVHFVETNEEWFCRFAMRHEKRRNELTGNEVAIQVEVAEQFGAVIPIRANGNHGESTVLDRGSSGFPEQAYKTRLPCARVARENDKWLGAKCCIKTAHR